MTMRKRWYLMMHTIGTCGNGDEHSKVTLLMSSFDREEVEKELAKEVDIWISTLNDTGRKIATMVNQPSNVVFVESNSVSCETLTTLYSFFMIDTYDYV